MKMILMMGAPGSGKGTQSQLLIQKYPGKFHHVNCGEIVRGFLQDPEHPITKQYKTIIASGELLPDEVILSILKDHLQQLEQSFEERGEHMTILLDGYPRTLAQYQDYLGEFGRPMGGIELVADPQSLKHRMLGRNQNRLDDNERAIARRFKDFEQITKPLLDKLKKEGITQVIDSYEEPSQTFPQVERAIHAINQSFKQVSVYDASTTFYQTAGRITDFTKAIQHQVGSQNFFVKLPMMSPIYFIEDNASIRKVLSAPSLLGDVYQQFSKAAGLKFDFTNMNASGSEQEKWKCLHKAMVFSLQENKLNIKKLILKNIPYLLEGEQFRLDENIDNFFDHFWCELTTGNAEQTNNYHELKNDLLAFMKHCFYENQWKSLDITGLSSYLYAWPNQGKLNQLKDKLRKLIANASGGLIGALKQHLQELNMTYSADLSAEELQQMLEDAVFNLMFIPDFLNGAIYQTLVYSLKHQINFSNAQQMEEAYQAGLNHSYLFPYRARVMTESVTLPNGVLLPKGATAVLQLKESGLYHSSGPRSCPGMDFTKTFRKIFFDVLSPLELNLERMVKNANEGSNLQDENVPVDPNHYYVNWSLKRNVIQNTLHAHSYKGLPFYDVLEVYEQPVLRKLVALKTYQMIQKIVAENNLSLNDVVVVAPEMRGVPLGTILADHLEVPFVTVRKAGGYKMQQNDVFTESYQKGYGQTDSLELPKIKASILSGKKVILLDDGIASGQSILACKRLVKRMNGETVGILNMINHEYAKRAESFDSKHCIHTFFDIKSTELVATDEKQVLSC